MSSVLLEGEGVGEDSVCGDEVDPLRTPDTHPRMGGRLVGVQLSGGVSQTMRDGTELGHSGPMIIKKT